MRLFEAAACGTPIISDYWTGLEEIFEPGREILVARSADDTLRFLQTTPKPIAPAAVYWRNIHPSTGAFNSSDMRQK